MVYQRREVFYQGNQLFHSIKPFGKELYTQWKRKNQTDGLGMIFNFPKKVSAPIAFVSMHFPLLIHPLFLRFFFFFTFLKLAGNSFQPTGRPAVASTRTHTYIWPQLTFRLGLGCLCNTYALQQASSQIAGQISPARRKNEKQAQPFSSPSPSHHYVVLLTVQKVTQHPTVETGRQTAEREEGEEEKIMAGEMCHCRPEKTQESVIAKETQTPTQFRVNFVAISTKIP